MQEVLFYIFLQTGAKEESRKRGFYLFPLPLFFLVFGRDQRGFPFFLMQQPHHPTCGPGLTAYVRGKLEHKGSPSIYSRFVRHVDAYLKTPLGQQDVFTKGGQQAALAALAKAGARLISDKEYDQLEYRTPSVGIDIAWADFKQQMQQSETDAVLAASLSSEDVLHVPPPTTFTVRRILGAKIQKMKQGAGVRTLFKVEWAPEWVPKNTISRDAKEADQVLYTHEGRTYPVQTIIRSDPARGFEVRFAPDDNWYLSTDMENVVEYLVDRLGSLKRAAGRVEEKKTGAPALWVFEGVELDPVRGKYILHLRSPEPPYPVHTEDLDSPLLQDALFDLPFQEKWETLKATVHAFARHLLSSLPRSTCGTIETSAAAMTPGERAQQAIPRPIPPHTEATRHTDVSMQRSAKSIILDYGGAGMQLPFTDFNLCNTMRGGNIPGMVFRNMILWPHLPAIQDKVTASPHGVYFLGVMRHGPDDQRRAHVRAAVRAMKRKLGPGETRVGVGIVSIRNTINKKERSLNGAGHAMAFRLRVHKPSDAKLPVETSAEIWDSHARKKKTGDSWAMRIVDSHRGVTGSAVSVLESLGVPPGPQLDVQNLMWPKKVVGVAVQGSLLGNCSDCAVWHAFLLAVGLSSQTIDDAYANLGALGRLGRKKMLDWPMRMAWIVNLILNRYLEPREAEGITGLTLNEDAVAEFAGFSGKGGPHNQLSEFEFASLVALAREVQDAAVTGKSKVVLSESPILRTWIPPSLSSSSSAPPPPSSSSSSSSTFPSFLPP